MVRCETIDVLVPAWAEIIIEGEIPPNTFEDEGPWGDFTRYHQVAKRHPVKIKAITYRKIPLYTIWVPGRVLPCRLWVEFQEVRS